MNFGEMQAEVRRLIGEASANYWTDQEIKDAINEGLKELADASEWFERSTNISSLSHRTYLDSRGLLSDDFIAPKRCRNINTGRWLVPSHVRQLDNGRGQWESVSSEPHRWMTRGLWFIGFFPNSPRDGDLFKLYFSALPADLSEDTDTPEIPSEYHYGPVNYAVYDLLSQEEETDKAMLWFNEYIIYETKLTQYVSGRTSMDRVGGLHG